MAERFSAWIVRETEAGIVGSVEQLTDDQLPIAAGPSAVMEVEYSSLNYKDALACRGNRGVAPRLPHVPGIDCAGRVVESDDASLPPGTPALVTGYDLGGKHWGGFAGRVRVPADWVVPLPEGFSPREAMTLGTAGFTAAQCVMAIADRVDPASGDVAVTGATGGVGVWAVALLAKLGYRVVAVTGKADRADDLRALGAADVAPRDVLVEDSDAPLLSARWAAAVDTVGGEPLRNLLRAASHRGVVAACGLVAGVDLGLTVHPFILRGVTLAGIDSAKCPPEPRREVWRRLTGDWRLELPDQWVETVTLEQLPDRVEQILAGGVAGRTLVRPVP